MNQNGPNRNDLRERGALTDTANIHALRITDQSLRRTLGLMWRTGHALRPAAGALRDFLREG